MRFCDWLKQNRLNRKLLQADLAKILGKKQAYISLLESSYPTPVGDELLKKIVDYFNSEYKEILLMVTLERLPDFVKEDYSNFINGLDYAVSHLNIKSIPFIPKLPRGFTKPLPSMQFEVIQLFENSLNFYHPDLDFFTTAPDDGLLKAGIKKSDICLIGAYKGHDLNGEIVLAEVQDYNDYYTLMRYYHKEGEFILLLPDNPDFRPQIMPEHKVRIIGIILKSIRIFNHLKNQPKLNFAPPV
jgi:transcriptional regulator with XRE-family HTH domain